MVGLGKLQDDHNMNLMKYGKTIMSYSYEIKISSHNQVKLCYTVVIELWILHEQSFEMQLQFKSIYEMYNNFPRTE